MFKVGDLVKFKILAGSSGVLWRWKEGIAHVVGGIYLDDGQMFYEIQDADGTRYEALECEIEMI